MTNRLGLFFAAAAVAALTASSGSQAQAWKNCVQDSYGPGGCLSYGPGGGKSYGPGGGQSYGPGGGKSYGPEGGQSYGPGGGQSYGPGGGKAANRNMRRGLDTDTLEQVPPSERYGSPNLFGQDADEEENPHDHSRFHRHD